MSKHRLEVSLNKYDRHQRAPTPAPRAPHIVAAPPAVDNAAARSRPELPPSLGALPLSPWGDLLLVAGFALVIRLIFLVLTRDTFDYDEFVALQLGRDWAHGAVPYRDFMFFHPPGILFLTRLLDPLFHLWWPLSRLFISLVDTATAIIVARLGYRLWGRRVGLCAGVVYALSPVALISGVRLGEDPLITFLGALGLVLLLRDSARWTIAAGVCLGLAIWTKYPAAYFAPIYLLAAPRRALVALLSAALTFALLMLPFHADLQAFYQQTVTFQRTRWSMDAVVRLQTTALFWLAANALAVLALLWKGVRSLAALARQSPTSALSRNVAPLPTRPIPAWAIAGFLLGGLFAFTSQVYYHYFVVVVPFAALLAGWLLAQTRVRIRSALLLIGLALAAGWGILLDRGGSAPLYVTAAHLSALRPTIQLLDRDTPPDGRILADQFEYAYLADRPAVDQYFWNVGVLVGPQFLEPLLPRTSAVVLSYGASSGYPPRFITYLGSHFPRIDTPTTTVWITRR